MEPFGTILELSIQKHFNFFFENLNLNFSNRFGAFYKNVNFVIRFIEKNSDVFFHKKWPKDKKSND